MKMNRLYCAIIALFAAQLRLQAQDDSMMELDQATESAVTEDTAMDIDRPASAQENAAPRAEKRSADELEEAYCPALKKARIEMARNPRLETLRQSEQPYALSRQ